MLNKEMGKPLEEGKQELKSAIGAIRFYCKEAEEALKPTLVEMGFKKAMTVYQPIGVIYSITPWNFPVGIAIRANIQSMLAGNTVVHKPPPNTPQIGELL